MTTAGYRDAFRGSLGHMRNPFGKHAHEQQRILEDMEAVEPLLRATSTVEIATTIPVTKVVDALESIARRADDGTAGRFTHP